ARLPYLDMGVIEKLSMPIEKVRKVMKIAKEPISLETPVGDEEDSHLGDFIEDKNAILPIDAAIQANLRETTTRVLASLTPREEHVLAATRRHIPRCWWAGVWKLQRFPTATGRTF